MSEKLPALWVDKVSTAHPDGNVERSAWTERNKSLMFQELYIPAARVREVNATLLAAEEVLRRFPDELSQAKATGFYEARIELLNLFEEYEERKGEE